MGACNGLIATLSKMEGKIFLKSLKKRILPMEQTAVRFVPHSIWDYSSMSSRLMSGCKRVSRRLTSKKMWQPLAFGATLENVQSGIGMVHNSFMLEKRTVIEAPFHAISSLSD